MTDPETLSDTERMLLMAAAVLGLGPDTNMTRANTVRVIHLVLRWLGLSDEEIRGGWQESGDHPVHASVYNALIRMTYQMPNRPQERPGEPLFEGGGNWGVPGDPTRPACWPHFNSCRLTEQGERVAQQLLAQDAQPPDESIRLYGERQ